MQLAHEADGPEASRNSCFLTGSDLWEQKMSYTNPQISFHSQRVIPRHAQRTASGGIKCLVSMEGIFHLIHPTWFSYSFPDALRLTSKKKLLVLFCGRWPKIVKMEVNQARRSLVSDAKDAIRSMRRQTTEWKKKKKHVQAIHLTRGSYKNI